MSSTGFDEYRHLTEAARRLEAYKRMEPCIQNDGQGDLDQNSGTIVMIRVVYGVATTSFLETF